jgi:hypothetical protein
MTVKEVMVKAINGEISWIAAAEIAGITARQMRSPPRRRDGRSGSGTNRGDRGQQAEGCRAHGTK